MTETTYFSDTGNIEDLVRFVEKRPESLESPEHGIAGGRTLLHIAAAYGDVEVCDRLIQMGLSINCVAASTGNGLPLGEAASRGRFDAVAWLLQNGSEVDGPANSVTTPLMNAIVSGHREIVETLLESGADVNRLHLRYNQTPLDLALVWKRADIANLLVSNGGKRAIEPIDLAAERGSGILEHIYGNVGPILSTRLLSVKKRSSSRSLHDIELRVALVNEDKSCKLLFTMGVHESVPRQELMMCLPFDWPVSKRCMDENLPYSFPIHAMSLFVERRLSGEVLRSGEIFDRSLGDDQLIWPDEVDALVVVDYQFNHAERERQSDEEVTLLMLVPFRYPKAGRPTETKMTAWVEKQRLASWKKIALR